MKQVKIFDSTLRDGAQGEGIAFSVEDKLNIVRALDDIGVSYVEAGNPGSNPKDLEFFARAKELTLKNAKLCAFGSTRRKGIAVEEDANVLSLLKAETGVVSLFGKCWDLHVTGILNATLEENLAMIEETVRFFKDAGKEVVFDAEHFFDGYAENPDYAMAALSAAVKGGADTLCLCDTNGAAYPTDVKNITEKVCAAFPSCSIGIHCHNDTGMAVANSMLAVDGGATHVQGTFIGFGERCGNANLSAIIPNLELKRGVSCLPEGRLAMLTQTARHIAEIANVPLSGGKPYVGHSAFAHKGGMHIDGVSKLSRSFEHVSPETVGNERRFLMSEVSGRSTILSKIKQVDPSLTKDSPETMWIMERLKQLEHKGFQFEAAEESFTLLIYKELGLYRPYFELISFRVLGECPFPSDDYSASAMIEVKVDGTTEITAAKGQGPVHALDQALRKALMVFYPTLAEMRLTDYKVRVLEPKGGTAAKVRVLIESTDGEDVWTTVGVSEDIIQASWGALVDSIEYKLLRDGQSSWQ
ncbi:MAG TPA: citramalate synthase [Clostridiales bacterium]|nr:citramalate synthase [Clostridiales bacterium]